MNRDTFLAERRTGIGGSDVAAILGLSKWRTPYEVWLDKRGELTPMPENDGMKWGRLLEPVVRDAYATERGVAVRSLPSQIRSTKVDCLIANLDGFTDEPRIYEGKTARSAEGWGESGSDEVPTEYLLQVQHYMAVASTVGDVRFDVADIAVLIGGSDFRTFTIEADRELQQMAEEACVDFWKRVQTDDPPEPVNVEDANRRWGRASTGDLVMATEEVEAAVARLRDIKAEAKALEEEEKAARLVIYSALGASDTLVDVKGKRLATWKAQAGRKFLDAKRLEEKWPGAFADVERTGDAFRVLLLK